MRHAFTAARRTTAFVVLGSLTFVCGCAAASTDEPSNDSTQALGKGGGGPSGQSCDDQYGDCYVGCDTKYPESNDSESSLNEQDRQGCEDSCDASYNLCKSSARETPPNEGEQTGDYSWSNSALGRGPRG